MAYTIPRLDKHTWIFQSDIPKKKVYSITVRSGPSYIETNAIRIWQTTWKPRWAAFVLIYAKFWSRFFLELFLQWNVRTLLMCKDRQTNRCFKNMSLDKQYYKICIRMLLSFLHSKCFYFSKLFALITNIWSIWQKTGVCLEVILLRQPPSPRQVD